MQDSLNVARKTEPSYLRPPHVQNVALTRPCKINSRKYQRNNFTFIPWTKSSTSAPLTVVVLTERKPRKTKCSSNNGRRSTYWHVVVVSLVILTCVLVQIWQEAQWEVFAVTLSWLCIQNLNWLKAQISVGQIFWDRCLHTSYLSFFYTGKNFGQKFLHRRTR